MDDELLIFFCVAGDKPTTIEEKKEALMKEKKTLKKIIYNWTKDFIAKNQREPTKAEKELLAKEMFKKYKQV